MPASLTPERWAQVQQLFDEVIELEPSARAARLDRACAADPALREEVTSLLAAYERADDLLQSLEHLAGPPLSPASSDDARAGTRAGHYEVMEKLGGGGMGVVYKARDTRLKRTVALKFLPVQWSHHLEARQRFEHEAQAASALDHPNVCTIHDIGETDDGHLFIAMAYYDGQTLKKKIKRGALPLDEALDYAVQMARGLEKAHGQGIVHRDIKPANVMVTTDGIVKILDFGLAKMADVQLTQTGTTMGTLAYMSPEQTRGDKVDHRTDLWSLGVVLYEMLTGERPFQGDYDQAIIYSLLHQDPPPISALNAERPEALEHVVALCLEKEKELRYPTMADLLADLDVFVQGDEESAEPPRREARRKQQRVFVGVGAGLLMLLALALLIPASRQVILGLSGGAPTRTHVAVLPFINNLGDDPKNQALVDGLMPSLTGIIARLETVENSLWVVPASEVLRQSIVTASEAGTRFGVNTVLTGRVQRTGAATEVVLDLIDPQGLRLIDTETLPGPQDPAFQEAMHEALVNLLGVRLTARGRRAVTADAPTAPDAYAFYLQGMGYLQRLDKEGNIDDAVTLFRQALDEDPRYALAHAGLCKAVWEQYRLTNDTAQAEEALRSCDRAAALAEDQAGVLVPLGSIYLGTGQHEKAETALRRALDLEPDNADAYRWLGRLYDDQALFDPAKKAYEQAIALKPNNWIYYNELGIMLAYAGHPEEAGKQFEQVRRLTPDNYLAYNALAVIRLQLNQVAQADTLFRRSLEKQPNALAYRNLGFLNLRGRQYDAAIRALERGLALNRNDWWTWRWLGHAHHGKGQEAQAQVAWQRIIDLATPQLDVNPREPDVLCALAEAHVALGNHDQGRLYLDRLLALPRSWNYNTYFIGRLYEMLGDRETALVYVEQALNDRVDPVTIDRDPWLEDLRTDSTYLDLRQRFLTTTADPPT